MCDACVMLVVAGTVARNDLDERGDRRNRVENGPKENPKARFIDFY